MSLVLDFGTRKKEHDSGFTTKDLSLEYRIAKIRENIQSSGLYQKFYPELKKYDKNFLNSLSLNKLLYKPMPAAISALQSDPKVKIKVSDDEIIFSPQKNESGKGIVFFAGCLVDIRSYAPFARALAENGHKVAIFDLSLKDFSEKRSSDLFKDSPEVNKWYFSGHSLGGVFCTEHARFAKENVGGVILLSSYPINSFKNNNIPFLDIRAENDNIGCPFVSDVAFKMNVPKNNVTTINIPGGNHGNFGYYGNQFLDGTATISREEQHKIVIKNVLDFMK